VSVYELTTATSTSGKTLFSVPSSSTSGSVKGGSKRKLTAAQIARQKRIARAKALAFKRLRNQKLVR
jgi:hypothetical protein